MNTEVDKTLEVLLKGGVILYPTDTIWGLGCDATQVAAAQKIVDIKNRPGEKSFILLVDSDQMLMRYVKEVPEVAWEIMELSEKPVTIIYDNPCNLPSEIIAADNTVAIRKTNDPFCVALMRKLKKPLVSTSANVSGEKSPQTFAEISTGIKNSVDHIVNLRQDEKKPAQASSIIRIKTNGEFKIIRH